ncbi:unnamed protein product [Notodromas monacha]|uniref:Uncharacterized protein n=1 Tax=Notodromas monacha TaxID=399045 RepID=A0A7R9BDN6_9CRUS|nr:unnamed protein product [Notodromas monacha]CAG0913408.1 unnamed protein product [Notodromas monacha]
MSLSLPVIFLLGSLSFVGLVLLLLVLRHVVSRGKTSFNPCADHVRECGAQCALFCRCRGPGLFSSACDWRDCFGLPAYREEDEDTEPGGISKWIRVIHRKHSRTSVSGEDGHEAPENSVKPRSTAEVPHMVAHYKKILEKEGKIKSKKKPNPPEVIECVGVVNELKLKPHRHKRNFFSKSAFRTRDGNIDVIEEEPENFSKSQSVEIADENDESRTKASLVAVPKTHDRRRNRRSKTFATENVLHSPAWNKEETEREPENSLQIDKRRSVLEKWFRKSKSKDLTLEESKSVNVSVVECQDQQVQRLGSFRKFQRKVSGLFASSPEDPNQMPASNEDALNASSTSIHRASEETESDSFQPESNKESVETSPKKSMKRRISSMLSFRKKSESRENLALEQDLEVSNTEASNQKSVIQSREDVETSVQNETHSTSADSSKASGVSSNWRRISLSKGNIFRKNRPLEEFHEDK